MKNATHAFALLLTTLTGCGQTYQFLAPPELGRYKEPMDMMTPGIPGGIPDARSNLGSWRTPTPPDRTWDKASPYAQPPSEALENDTKDSYTPLIDGLPPVKKTTHKPHPKAIKPRH